VSAPEQRIDEAERERLPKVGVVSAWFDPEDPRQWSGVSSALIGELRRLGVYAGHRSSTPWPGVSRLIYRWAKLTGREKGWTRRPEMRVVTRLSDLMLRSSTPADIDGWIHLPNLNGPVTRGRYVTFHDTSPAQLLEAGPAMAASFGYPYATKAQLEWVVRRQVSLYKGAYAVCVASPWVADSLVRDHGIDARKIRVVAYGRNADMLPPADRDWSTPRFLFIGRNWKRKNGDAVVRAFIRVRKEVPEARLDLVGGHPPLDVEGVTGHGHVAVSQPEGRAKIEALFAAATCFVVPSLMEPFGIVYLEAGAAGLPCIATKNGGMHTSAGSEGIVFLDPLDDEAIYRAMRSMCDPNLASRTGEIALERAPLFTWSAFGQRILRSLDLPPIPGVTLADFL
jgi:glycosyltransferase involved in cell wall biosynthesis